MAAAATDVAAEEGEKEGAGLVAPPTFAELPNGRVKCVETGYEMVTGDVQCYSRSKRCRLGLIDFALAHNKPPLNMFKQDPLCRSMLICKLTGDRVNKSEKHIWKHINGRRFLHKLEQKEEVDVTSKRKMGVVNMKKKKEEQKTKKTADEIKSELRDPSERNSNFAGDSGDFELISGAESEQDSDVSEGNRF
ncbi:surfeit locus protein 2-like isoform X2 [Punica granatum]|uniref:Surfeit locus protein 2-like isoform X2 n=1 Tax=Punica granatum TaxID=22663 RepID=A0A6P8E8A7_PUNGR|nr:surfeit locus protein 2-like isoform X2 [Punica granatum]